MHDLPGLLRPGDLLVRNDTRVLAARTFFRRSSGGRLEVLFLQPVDEAGAAVREKVADAAAFEAGGAARPSPRDAPADQGTAAETAGAVPVSLRGEEVWEVLVRGRPRAGERLSCIADETWRLDLVHRFGDGRWLVRNAADTPVQALLERHGETPLPPYIRHPLEDPERYQTTFAARSGSAAAPTAGLHFTRQLDRRLGEAGVQIAELTLHVGLGTFKPLDEATVCGGRLHAERFVVPAQVWRQVSATRAAGGRVVAVGTTVVRTLEHVAASVAAAPPADGSAGDHDAAGREPATVMTTGDGAIRGTTDLLIAPGFRFRVVDALLTNFHLPGSSLLALIAAFCGLERTRAVYQHAVARRYRFYSLGDAMLAIDR
ncbi:MAG: S-adenosylmethionine:tRNA ribosyltransferase-isomerase [Actinobacteria bacterium]|nr:S-adenosylmethionine:tRNA ribosyltransferase-isomerase [Actinomycetota bacterium]